MDVLSAPSQPSGRWVDSEHLRPGDFLLTKSGTVLRLESMAIRDVAGLPVYNFTVGDLHRYAVMNCEVLVHNSLPCWEDIVKGLKGTPSSVLRKALGDSNPYPVPWDAHHIFPRELFDTPLGKRLHDWGINFHGAENGVKLPVEDYKGRVASLHRGRTSKAYLNYARKELARAKSKGDAEAILERIGKQLLNGIVSINGAK